MSGEPSQAAELVPAGVQNDMLCISQAPNPGTIAHLPLVVAEIVATHVFTCFNIGG